MKVCSPCSLEFQDHSRFTHPLVFLSSSLHLPVILLRCIHTLSLGNEELDYYMPPLKLRVKEHLFVRLREPSSSPRATLRLMKYDGHLGLCTYKSIVEDPECQGTTKQCKPD
ncbi:hypothetical protein VTK56DRAFT_9600 [Thermocarpiscus australiensis]